MALARCAGRTMFPFHPPRGGTSSGGHANERIQLRQRAMPCPVEAAGMSWRGLARPCRCLSCCRAGRALHIR